MDNKEETAHVSLSSCWRDDVLIWLERVSSSLLGWRDDVLRGLEQINSSLLSWQCDVSRSLDRLDAVRRAWERERRSLM